MNRFFTLLLAASCLTAVGQVPDYVPTDGLVAWYPFNGDAADFSANGHHGTLDGAGSAPDRNGLLDQSLFVRITTSNRLGEQIHEKAGSLCWQRICEKPSQQPIFAVRFSNGWRNAEHSMGV